MDFSDVMRDDQDPEDEVIFVTPHVQPIFVPDSDHDASWLILQLIR